MYLAEDRILCFAIVSMPHKHYTLHYEKNCVAVTDVPDDLTSLVKQRRRWLNGSFFAMLYALLHFYRIFTAANHGCLRKLAFLFQLMYYLLNVTITWFLPGSFYLSFYMVSRVAIGAASTCLTIVVTVAAADTATGHYLRGGVLRLDVHVSCDDGVSVVAVDGQ